MNNLTYVSSRVVEQLRQDVERNARRYLEGTFEDLATTSGWSHNTKFAVDYKQLGELSPDTGSAVEVANSVIVWKALGGFTPAAATEARIWTRLAHFECLDFSRRRWLRNIKSADLPKRVRAHFFGDSVTRYRDDHSIGRLWWNGYIAHRIAECDRQLSQEAVLKVMLHRADLRLNLLERPGLTSRLPLAAAVVRVIGETQSLLENEANFRQFMKRVNLRGAGVLFEALDAKAILKFTHDCVAS